MALKRTSDKTLKNQSPLAPTERARADRPSILERIEGRSKRFWKNARALPTARRARKLAKGYRIAGRWRRIYFYHIRKTGGTSLCRSFVGLASDDPRGAMEALSRRGGRLILSDKVYVGWNERLIEQGHYFCAWSHRPAHALALAPETFTVTCLRDPVARIISDYRNSLAQAQVKRTRSFERKYGHRLSSLAEYVRNSPKKDLLRQIYMFSASLSVDEAVKRIASCSHWFFIDQFDEGLEALSAKWPAL